MIRKFLKVVLAGSLLGPVVFQTADIYAMEEQNSEQKAKLTQFLQQKLHTGKLRPRLYRMIKKSIEPASLFAKVHSNDIEYVGMTLEEQQVLGELYQKYADLIPTNHLKEIAQTAAALPVADLLIKGGVAAVTAVTAGKVVEHNLKNNSSSISSSASHSQSKVTTAPSSSSRERLGPPAPANTWNKTTSVPSAQTASKKEQKRREKTGEQAPVNKQEKTRPRDNQRQNEQARKISQGLNLNKSQSRQFHEELGKTQGGKPPGFNEAREIAKNMFRK